MKFGWLTVGAVALVLMACGGASSGSRADPRLPSDAESLRDQIVEAMNELESYRTELYFGSPPELVWEYVKPDSYWTFFGADHVDGEIRKRVGGSEILYIGESIYMRECDDVDRNCQAWKTAPRGKTVITAPSPSYFPQWPIVALEMADDITASGGVLRGSVNHMRALFENSARLQGASGNTPTFSTECSSAATPIGGSGEEDCRTLTLAEELENQEPSVSFYDEHPARIEVEFDPETHLIGRFTVTIIEENEDADIGEQVVEPRTFTFTYSDYDSITIEAPE